MSFELGKQPSAAAAQAAPVSAWVRLWRRIRASLFWMVIIAFALRVGWIVGAHTYKFRANEIKYKNTDINFSFGYEMGRVGWALADGRGFSDPFGVPTGPTAWEPPLYPILIGEVFKVFGIYSNTSAFVLLTLNSLFSALTCIPIFLTARKIFSEKVGVGSAWTWALLPYVMFWCTRWVWETSLSAFLLALLFWLTLDMEERDGLKPWIVWGFLWGMTALNSPSLLAFLPAAGGWAWYHRARRRKSSIVGVALAAMIFWACITPWLVRDYKTFGKFIFIRDNFGAELRMGNGPGADGTWMQYLHPTQDTYALRQYSAMGELPYVAMRKQQAVNYIKADYARFAWLCVKRFIYYWNGPPRVAKIWWLMETRNSLFLASSVLMFWGLGRALRLQRPGAWLLFWLILLYPAIYYVVFPNPRYRHPIEPQIVILGIYVLTEARSGKQAAELAK